MRAVSRPGLRVGEGLAVAVSALAAVLCPGVPLAAVLARAWWPQPEPPSARAERLIRVQEFIP